MQNKLLDPLIKAVVASILALVAAPLVAVTESWVTVDRLNRRTCPSTQCGIVGVLMFREKATIHEERNGWARISKYYSASCRKGKSAFVEPGNAACVESNGIVSGEFAEWVSAKYLSKTRLTDSGAGATGDYALVSDSDDYHRYKDIFAKTASDLIASGRCTKEDFKKVGGWWRSKEHMSAPVYFTYCDGGTVRLYLNTKTGRVFK